VYLLELNRDLMFLLARWAQPHLEVVQRISGVLAALGRLRLGDIVGPGLIPKQVHDLPTELESIFEKEDILEEPVFVSLDRAYADLGVAPELELERR